MVVYAGHWMSEANVGNRRIPIWIRVIGGFVIWAFGRLKARHEARIGWEEGTGEDTSLIFGVGGGHRTPVKRDRKAISKDKLRELKRDPRFRDGIEQHIETP